MLGVFTCLVLLHKITYLLAVISPNSVCLSCAKRCASEPEVTYTTRYNNLGALHR